MIEDKIQDLFDDLRLDLITSKDFDSKAMITAITKEQTILIMNIINKNKQLEQALNEIREYIHSEEFFMLMNSGSMIEPPRDKPVGADYFEAQGKLDKIIDKVLGSDK